MQKGLLTALYASTCLVAAGAFAPVAFAASDVPVVSDAIGGVVTSSKGPEAGVWVIAETTDLPTRFIKEVVTDDQGRYLLPELPKAKYKVWVRGYGLVDSKPVEGKPGKNVNLKAIVAPDAAAAAQYYPANYWFALIHPPAASEFPGTGAAGNGIAPAMKNQQQWVATMKEGCGHCHQIGDKATRELANNSVAGWAERIQMARAPGDQAIGNHGKQASAGMQNALASFGHDGGLKVLADWTARVAKGEIPTETPPRPTGIERNIVISMWDWANGRFVHDVSTTDRRNPTVNAYGPVYSGATFAGTIEALNPKTNTNEEIGYNIASGPGGSITNVTSENPDVNMQPHNPMVDGKGRLWLADMGRSPGEGQVALARPDFCADSANNKYAKYYPMPGKFAATIVMYDPATKKLAAMPTCSLIHHLMFNRDTQDTLYFSGPGSDIVSWIDTKVWDETHDAQKAEGWCPMVIDTKEKGVTKAALNSGDDVKITPDRTMWNEPGKPADPKKDTRVGGGQYGIDISPLDGSVWFVSQTQPFPSTLIRFEKGAHPPETCKTEIYQPPKSGNDTYVAFDGRGASVDSKGVVWEAFGSGQIGSFDRSKCKVTSGPDAASGQQCPEGWKFYNIPGPKITGVNAQSDWNYLTWVDLYDTLGLGKDTPIAPGTWSDSLIALKPDSGEMIRLRVPYPMGFYARGVDGRIDDPKAGWKGRGLWNTYAQVPVWHQEGGLDGDGPELVHLQIRPDPLAH